MLGNVQIKDKVQDRDFHFVLGVGMVVDQSFFWAEAEVGHSVQVDVSSVSLWLTPSGVSHRP